MRDHVGILELYYPCWFDVVYVVDIFEVERITCFGYGSTLCGGSLQKICKNCNKKFSLELGWVGSPLRCSTANCQGSFMKEFSVLLTNLLFCWQIFCFVDKSSVLLTNLPFCWQIFFRFVSVMDQLFTVGASKRYAKSVIKNVVWSEEMESKVELGEIWRVR